MEDDNRKLVSIQFKLKKRYEEIRRRTQPDFISSKKNNIHFSRAADLVFPLKIDVNKFIDAQFSRWEGEGYPQPSNLYSDAALVRFNSISEEERCSPELELKNQIKYLTSYVKRAKLTQDEALLATWTQFRSWFRILACSEEAAAEVISLFGDEGMSQIENDSALKKYLKTKCPNKIESLFGHKQQCIPIEHEELPPCSEEAI